MDLMAPEYHLAADSLAKLSHRIICLHRCCVYQRTRAPLPMSQHYNLCLHCRYWLVSIELDLQKLLSWMISLSKRCTTFIFWKPVEFHLIYQKQLGFDNRWKHEGENVSEWCFLQLWAVTGIYFILSSTWLATTIQNYHNCHFSRAI